MSDPRDAEEGRVGKEEEKEKEEEKGAEKEEEKETPEASPDADTTALIEKIAEQVCLYNDHEFCPSLKASSVLLTKHISL
jgi:hypothetical protein